MKNSKKPRRRRQVARSSGMTTSHLDAGMGRLLQQLLASSQPSLTNKQMPRFLGVYPFDRFPISEFIIPSSFSLLSSHPSISLCCLVNTDPSSRPGKHWLAVFQPSFKTGHIEFFDSYGLSPEFFGFSSLVKHFPFIESNPFPLQAPTSSVCGEYCLLFLFLRALLFITPSRFSPIPSHPPNTPFSFICKTLHAQGATPAARDRNIQRVISQLLAASRSHRRAPPPIRIGSQYFLEQASEPFEFTRTDNKE